MRLSTMIFLACSAPAAANAACPEVTVANDLGLVGAFPQQFELEEFEAAGNCTLSFKENPDIAALNASIAANPAPLPLLSERLPDEPLVVAPYQEIGQYGGTFHGFSTATESGTGEILSMRQVNFVRYSDDLKTIVPNVAKSWSWNEDYTELTFNLRRDHKWSDGAPFTADDVVFWYNDMLLDPNIVGSVRDIWTAGGEPFEVEALDPQTVVFRLRAPKPGLLAAFADDYAQPFQPKHILARFHPSINPDADAAARAAGFESGYDVIAFYYGGSDWKDVPSPLIKDPSKIPLLPTAVLPTLESFILVAETSEGRKYVANPYFHMVDTAGNQLPYISEFREEYVSSNEVRVLRMINGEIDYKGQSNSLPDLPTYLDNQERGNYEIALRPRQGMQVIGFNLTPNDEEKRAVFGNRDFRTAMGRAIDRVEINKVVNFELGSIRQYVGFDPVPAFATEDQSTFEVVYDPEATARTLDALGLIDKDGDGFRDLPSGRRLTLDIQFSASSIPPLTVELVAQNWNAVGIKTTVKEVTNDEYRAAQTANELDIIMGRKGEGVPIVMASAEDFIVPFGDYFGIRNGILWSRYRESGGAEGLPPPEWVVEIEEVILEWQQHLPGTPESDKLGHRAIELLQEGFAFTAISETPEPIYRSLRLRNVELPRVARAFRHVYVYRPQQWWLTE